MNRLLFVVITLACFASSSAARIKMNLGADFKTGIAVDATSLVSLPDSVESAPDIEINHDWRYLLRHRRLDPADPNVEWPGFIGTCVKVYYWFDRTFNHYDSTYVKSTGFRGRVRLKPEFWTTAMTFDPRNQFGLAIGAPFNTSIGLHLDYSILSVGYTFDMGSSFRRDEPKHEKTEIGFKTARVCADLHYWRDHRGTYITHYGNYNHGKRIHEFFDGYNFRAVTANAIYLFNSDRFCLGAAYDASNIQRKSAGSWIAGLNGAFYKIDLDFNKLSPVLQANNHYEFDHFKAFYNSINLIGGYSYNWVVGRHWLFNITALPGMGISTSLTEQISASEVQYSSYFKGQASCTYNRKRFFFNVQGIADVNFFISNPVFTTMSVINLSMTFGLRF